MNIEFQKLVMITPKAGNVFDKICRILQHLGLFLQEVLLMKRGTLRCGALRVACGRFAPRWDSEPATSQPPPEGPSSGDRPPFGWPPSRTSPSSRRSAPSSTPRAPRRWAPPKFRQDKQVKIFKKRQNGLGSFWNTCSVQTSKQISNISRTVNIVELCAARDREAEFLQPVRRRGGELPVVADGKLYRARSRLYRN